ncbi:unnamed protein product [Bursaphelenchus okinawaensis]|uniref:Uncharacterized protein n=1 Tax=Bursaphelenchus okinawaensis TaxID=465554 RepID=A0A811LPH7_9BILA|nr:unnamed protein product [Bursaphelenchus okinawaensis]CAG9126376.1 unnamed protein product [Bursaphelenchus okinawaensis]
MDLDPHILQIEPPEEVHYLLGCCVQWPLTKSARLVAYISLISAICNLCIMLFAQEASLHVVVDGIILAVEFFCVFSLFYGINKKKARALKPFIVCGTIWNAFLAILWLCCVIQLFDRDKFTSEVLSNLRILDVLGPSSSPRTDNLNGNLVPPHCYHHLLLLYRPTRRDMEETARDEETDPARDE